VTDADALKLLELLAQYGVNYAPDVPLTVPALAEDLAATMDAPLRDPVDIKALEYLGQIRRIWGKC
jgi:hypothetical protein